MGRAFASHQCGLGSKPSVDAIRELSLFFFFLVECVVGSLLALRGFSPGSPVFPSP